MKDFLVCPSCNQPGNKRPGLKKVKGGAEAVFSSADDSVVQLEWIECRACGYRWPVAAGSVIAVPEGKKRGTRSASA